MSLPTNYLTATETLALVAADKLTVTQIAKDHLARFDQRDKDIHAWVNFDRERVLEEAKRLDAIPKEKRGLLHGLILGVKDMMNTKDMPTEHYSPIYKDSRPGVDAAPVAICRAAGALIYGKTYTTEFAFTTTGPPTCNPFNQDHTPGGSSSGSAAAVADWQCHAALGTQTGGSTLRPGSYNGIFAMKPTWGAISREGLKISSLTLDTLGIFTRSIPDLQLFIKIFQLIDDIPPPLCPKPLKTCKFGYVKTDQWFKHSSPSKTLETTWEHSKYLLQAAGATIEEIDLPSQFNGIRENEHKIILDSEGRSNFLAEYSMGKDKLSKEIVGTVENSRGWTKRQLLDAYDQVAVLRPLIDEIAGRFDALITPSVPDIAPAGLESTGDPRFQAMWTLLHVPLINIPGFVGDGGMPIGLALVAPRYEDQRLLSVSEAVAKVWIDADKDKLNKLPAPEGARHCIA